jgi:hypothetical protein
MSNSSVWNVAATRVMNIYAIVIFLILWIGLAIALAVNPEWLDLLWNWVRGLPLLVEIVVWALLLPIMVGLWIWESSWPVLVRLLGAAGIAGWTVVAVVNFCRMVREWRA